MHGFSKVIVAILDFPATVHIADAPIELLQSILRCSSIALHLVFELTDPSSLLRTPALVLCLRVSVSSQLSATGNHDLLREDEVADF